LDYHPGRPTPGHRPSHRPREHRRWPVRGVIHRRGIAVRTRTAATRNKSATDQPPSQPNPVITPPRDSAENPPPTPEHPLMPRSVLPLIGFPARNRGLPPVSAPRGVWRERCFIPPRCVTMTASQRCGGGAEVRIFPLCVDDHGERPPVHSSDDAVIVPGLGVGGMWAGDRQGMPIACLRNA
jgi:hypothetical protein